MRTRCGQDARGPRKGGAPRGRPVNRGLRIMRMGLFILFSYDSFVEESRVVR
ncbi:MAG: hypothetical protein [Olavius algarvensis Gamma 1 endosymbiont]|nr:MAG: hypothetical protein [Olavius algarvensis Gamma 1 endosymbiont]